LKQSNIDYLIVSNAVAQGYIQFVYTIHFTGNRIFNKDTKPSILTEGDYFIHGNQYFELEIRRGANGSRKNITVDGNVGIVSSDNWEQTNIKYIGITEDGNGTKYGNSMSDTSTFPTQESSLPNIQDHHGIRTLSKTRHSSPAFYPYVMSVHTKPLVFSGNEHKYGPIIQDDDGDYHIITTHNGSSIDLKKVNNVYLIDFLPNMKTAREVIKENYDNGESIPVLELNEVLTKENNVWKNSQEIQAIGRGGDIAKLQGPSGWHTSPFWNLDINQGYVWQNSYWSFLDVYHSQRWDNTKTIRAVGALSQRPLTGFPGFIYYATDQNQYYKWNEQNQSYSNFSPVF